MDRIRKYLRAIDTDTTESYWLYREWASGKINKQEFLQRRAAILKHYDPKSYRRFTKGNEEGYISPRK